MTAQELTYTVEHYHSRWLLRCSDGSARWYGSEAAARAQIPPAGPGAAYQPGTDWTNGGQLDLADWRDPREVRVRDTPANDDAIQIEMGGEVPLAPVLERCPPSEKTSVYGMFVQFHFAARQMWRSSAQRAMFQDKADALLVDAEPDEAARRWALLGARKVSTSTPPRVRRSQSFIGRGQNIAAKYARRKRHGVAPLPSAAIVPTAPPKRTKATIPVQERLDI